jgi:Ca2+-binding EF-hand superfamily protein
MKSLSNKLIQLNTNSNFREIPNPKIENSKNENVKTLSFFERMNLNIRSSSPIINYIKNYLQTKQLMDSDRAIDSLIYGIELKRVNKSGTMSNNLIYISDKVQTDMFLLNKDLKTFMKINLLNIKEICIGSQKGIFEKLKAKNFKYSNMFKNDICITIYITREETLDFIFNDPDSLNEFLTGILCFYENESLETELLDANEYNIKKLWNLYDRDRSGKIQFDEFNMFLSRINLQEMLLNSKLEIEAVRSYFNKLDKDKTGKIDFKEFIKFYHELSTGKEFIDFFKIYAMGKTEMTCPDFLRFMKYEQKENEISKEEALKIISEFSKTKVYKKEPSLTLEEFKSFIISGDYCDILDNSKLVSEQDMSFSLNNYFIFSSHNTFLTKHQLYGESNIEMYTFAMNYSCRLVEMDVWVRDKYNFNFLNF